MNTTNLVRQGVAVALVTMLAGCASWNGMSHQSKATTEGAAGGAVVGAAVGGPVGAAVGAGVGGVVAHNNADKVPTPNLPTANTNTASNDRNASTYSAPSSLSSASAMRSNSETPPNDNLATRNAAAGTANNTNAMVNDNNINASASGNSMQSQDRDTVREAQRALNDKGFSAGAVDGIMGPHTEQALRDFQQSQGIGVTGSLDAPTLSALGVAD
jgi:osmotically inducible lipoprotein OsmB